MSEFSGHGDLGIIALNNCSEFGKNIDAHILSMRGSIDDSETFLIPIEQVRFENGEGKIKILNTVRGKDIYILTDVGNYNCTYKMLGQYNRMSPDDHFQDIKRVVSAIGGKANRVTVVMPLLYASRQHRRNGRESLDCAMALRELENLGVNAILSFDVHDPSIHNAIPNTSFENIMPTYSVLKSFLMDNAGTSGAAINKDTLTVISPDTGAMGRAVYYANVLGVDVGMFYKRRDNTKIVDGKNPIVQHEYIGGPLDGKKILIVDDMIASGESIIDIIETISKYNVSEVYAATTFAFFTKGVEKFDKLYEEKRLTKLYSTNLSYIPDEIKAKPWFQEVDISKFVARIINTLSHDQSISPLLDATSRMRKLLKITNVVKKD